MTKVKQQLAATLFALACTIAGPVHAGLIYTFTAPLFTGTIELEESTIVSASRIFANQIEAFQFTAAGDELFAFTIDDINDPSTRPTGTLEFDRISLELTDIEFRFSAGDLSIDIVATGVETFFVGISRVLVDISARDEFGNARDEFGNPINQRLDGSFSSPSTSIATVPEPSPLILLAGGLIAFGVQRRVRKDKI